MLGKTSAPRVSLKKEKRSSANIVTDGIGLLLVGARICGSLRAKKRSATQMVLVHSKLHGKVEGQSCYHKELSGRNARLLVE
jgi:hypothetical protein